MSTTSHAKLRRRPPLSCTECRRRKVKCDRKTPCCHCVLWMKDCVYDEPRMSCGRPRRRPTERSPLQSSPGLSSPTLADSSEIALENNVEPPRESTRTDPLLHHELRELRDTLMRVEHLIEGNTPDESSKAAELNSNNESSGNKDKMKLRKSKLYGDTHWTSGSHLFRNVATFINPDANDTSGDDTRSGLKTEAHALIRKYKALAQRLKAAQSPAPHDEGGLLTRALADDMVRLYVSRFESVYRIVHVPSFWAEYEAHWTDSTNDMRKHKMRLVAAIGSSLCSRTNAANGFLAESRQWVHSAQIWLSLRMEKSKISISYLQMHCLLMLARQVLNVGGDLIWVSMGNVVRIAMLVGLHRDPTNFEGLTTLQREVRRRLWATIMEMNVQAALDAGTPVYLPLDESDTQPPANVNDADLDDTPSVSEPYPDNVTTDASLQRRLLKSLKSRIEIVRCLNGLRSEIKDADVDALKIELTNECKNVTLDGTVVGATFIGNLADLHLRRFLLPLYGSRVRASSENTSFSARKHGLDAALALLSPIPDDEFSQLCRLGGGMFRHRLIHVSLMLCSELLLEISDHGASVQEPCRYRCMLVEAVQEARQQWKQRLQNCETNIKIYAKLGIVLSQAGAGNGTAACSYENLARSITASLEEGCATLQTRAPEDVWTDEYVPADGMMGYFDFDDLWLPFGDSQLVS